MTNVSLKNLINNKNFVLMKTQRRNTELLIKIANGIKKLREEKKISQETFFIDTDIHIARIELGKVNITVSTLKDICDYFSISLTEFFESIEQSFSNNENRQK